MVDRQYPPEWKCRGTVPRHFLSKKCRKMSDLLTFNTDAAEICANVKKNAEH